MVWGCPVGMGVLGMPWALRCLPSVTDSCWGFAFFIIILLSDYATNSNSDNAACYSMQYFIQRGKDDSGR